MPLIINQQRAELDSWTSLLGDESAGGEEVLSVDQLSGDLLVSWEQWQKNRPALLSHDGRVGVKIDNDFELGDLIEDLDKLSLIALEFPVFSDGRAFSQARLLRQRYGYQGEIRAVGDVTWDRLRFMHRCGINAYEIAEDRYSDEMLEAFQEITVQLQGAADDPRPIYRQ
ncbi:DUF934 domain-containing protein [Motiliproteus sp. MSK22-1]|uniref:DUF934 domain-containing protein n=1 Tax=Motiliproteus sp. MSK22-1 TaxID=1897630 RepID=UPI00097589FB|nr:DUF934 domain-containing protein [Motiliproteus sp. MSK22-1]OMH33766.1 hypothetical protein BGP75_12285 [Motiliproteus sp. MSK22-1]